MDNRIRITQIGTLAILATVVILATVQALHAQKRPITARDCVEVRYIEGLWLSHRGIRVAYLVKSPNIDHNKNLYQLYVRNLNSDDGSGTASEMVPEITP